MIHPVDVPVLFAERRQYIDEDVEEITPLRKNAYGQCVANKISRRVLPQVVLQRGLTLWGSLFKETSRFPIAREEQSKGIQDSKDRLIFPEPVEPPTKKRPLELELADLYIGKNAALHHAADFNVVRRENDKNLVIRRGQPFEILLSFYRDVDADVDELKLVFETGNHPIISSSTRVILSLPLQEKTKSHELQSWCAMVKRLSGGQLLLEICVSANCIVGRWNLKVVTSLKAYPKNEYLESTSLISDIYILFNPWNKHDVVFMESEEVEEYVLNDVGKIWRGNSNCPMPCYWSYGQFEEGVLEACISVLDRSALPFPLRSNPAFVVRAMADMVQSPEGYSILEGSWAQSYFTGTAPTEWTGSTKILQQYAKTGRQIAYGHCWVFAGVMTTICRCLGIPTRVITCYQAAHDSEKLVTLDIYVRRSGKIDDEETLDKIWSYHVWNECWMRRPHLAPKYSGWQVVDATPQEKAGGLTRVGPAPVAAVKDGRFDLANDTASVIAEVNAEKCYWVENEVGEQRLVKVDENGIGKYLSTKLPGRKFYGLNNDDRLDVTHCYKLSNEKRVLVMESLFPGYTDTISRYLANNPEPDVDFQFVMDENFAIGDDVHFTVVMKNNAKQPRDVNLSLRVGSVHFASRNSIKVKHERVILSFGPDETRKFSSILSLNDYLSRCCGTFTFVVMVRAMVQQTEQIFVESRDFSATIPNITIKVLEQLTVGKSSEIEFNFGNPLPVTLTSCKFIVEGPGVVETVDVPCKKIPPRANAKASYTVRPFREGNQHIIIARFTCDQLKDIHGAIGVAVGK